MAILWPGRHLDQQRNPGALQSLLVGVPFHIAPVPEAPYVLLNVLSMGCLCLFAWYLCERLRDLPRWLVWGWLLTVPWTLEVLDEHHQHVECYRRPASCSSSASSKPGHQ